MLSGGVEWYVLTGVLSVFFQHILRFQNKNGFNN